MNNARFDAAQLALHLTEAVDWRESVKAYEAEMFVRIVESARHAADAVATILSHETWLSHWSTFRGSCPVATWSIETA